ncbi:hypothetical protein BVX93_01450, partial [bacterium B13(2017)]
MNIIEVKNIIKIFKKGIGKEIITALNNISFSVKKGNVVGVIGPNGSGKTTLFKCIMDYIRPDKGEIILFENKFKDLNLKSKIGFLYEKVNCFPELTPIEILNIYSALFDIPKSERKDKINDVLKTVELIDFKKLKVKKFSKGMIQRLGIAITIINNAELLIFDEPISGLDPFGAIKISEIIEGLVEKGKTILLSSHVLSHIEDLCSEILILFKGNLILSGKLNEFITNYEKFRIDLKLKNSDDGEKAISLLKKEGFVIEESCFSNQDLEHIFINLII